jgi:hypothetical protein
MRRSAWLVLVFALALTARAQQEDGMQFYMVGGVNSPDLRYGAVGADLFLVGRRLAATTSATFVSAKDRRDSLAEYRNPLLPGMRDTLRSTTSSTTTRLALFERLDFSPTKRFWASLTAGIIHDVAAVGLHNVYTVTPGNSSIIDSSLTITSNYLAAGIELKTALGSGTIGAGGIVLNNWTDVPTTEAYALYATNPNRPLILTLIAGAVRRADTQPLAQAALRWRATTTFEWVASGLYCGTAWMYDPIAHYQNFYFDAHREEAELMLVADVSARWRSFVGLTAEKTDRSLMGVVTIGAVAAL